MPTDPQSSTARDAAATKRLKKREIDRRCQREARQRTKSRIAYLEGLVEELRRKDTSGQVASLMQQVSEVRKERDMFARTLRGIEDSIRGHRSLREGGPSKESGEPPSEGHPASSTDATEHPATGFPAPLHAAADSCPGVDLTVPDPMVTEGVSDEIPPHIAATVPPEAPAWAAADPSMTSYGPPLPHPMFPSDGGNCECCELMSPQEVSNSTTREMERKNIWRFAHTVLDKPPLMTPKVLRWEDDNSEDVPVRAIAEGWSAVEARLGGHLPPIWRKLRRIDEVVFSEIGHVERLAILRVMHWLMRYHADPGTQKAKVPPWYLARPSQNMAHAYALDFFTWPGLRERFMFSPHSYCSNAFWRNHNAHMKLLWQYDFRDCYTVNRHTGVYQLSYAFEERITDINAWTMGADFFKRWPELYGDIPSFETNAIPMDNISAPRPGGFRSRPALPAPVAVVEEIEDDESASAASQRPTLELKEEYSASHAPLYAYPPAMMQPAVFGAHPRNAVYGNQQGYFAHGNGGMYLDPSHMPRTWAMRNADAIPEQDWLWFSGEIGPEFPEPA